MFKILSILVIAMVLICGCSTGDGTDPRSSNDVPSGNCFTKRGYVSEKTIQIAGTGSVLWHGYFFTIGDAMHEVSEEDWRNCNNISLLK